MQRDYCVYKHTSPSGKVYIGITCQSPTARWAGGRGYRKNEYFYHAIMKYGWDNFRHEIILDNLSKDEACAAEVALIASHRSNEPNYGYNITAGGDHYEHTETTKQKISKGHKNPSEETRRKIGAASRGRYPTAETLAKMSAASLGRTHTEETRRKISAANIGRKHSEDTRRKISENRKGKGRQSRSEITRQRISEHHAGGAAPVRVVCLTTGKIYASINDAARDTGVNKSPISKCCRGVKHYNTAGGLRWAYYDD